MIGTVLNTSIATGAMALTPEHAWIYLVICRLFVGFGVTGMYSVDITVVQEFVPTAKRGWLTGLTTTMLPAGFLFGALLSAFATPYIGWRGLFAVGLLPAFLTLYIRAWVPKSPYWLMRMGRFEEARQSLAWALQIDPKDIALPTVRPTVEQTRWTELFKYPRSIFAGALTGLSQTGGVALALWQVTLLVMVLKITAPEASKLGIWVALLAIAGRFLCSWISDAWGRRPAGVFSCLTAALFMSLAGYMHSVFIGGVSMFYVMILLQSFFGSGNYSIVGPYMGELWPARLRGSGMGFVYGIGNLGKFIGPAGLALIAGSSNYVKPEATLDALDPRLQLLRLLVRSRRLRLLVHRLRNKPPLDRADRRRADGAGVLVAEDTGRLATAHCSGPRCHRPGLVSPPHSAADTSPKFCAAHGRSGLGSAEVIPTRSRVRPKSAPSCRCGGTPIDAQIGAGIGYTRLGGRE